MKIFLVVTLVFFLAALLAHFILSGAFASRTEALRRALAITQTSAPPDQTPIPQLVRNFAVRNGGTVGGPPALTMMQSAEMRLEPDRPFFPIQASQLTGSRNPGFVWHAAGTMAGFIPIEVVDSYVDGKGSLEARIIGSIPVASVQGADVAKGEAMRFLAELAWNPDALLNADGLKWRQVDDQTVEVSLATSGGLARVKLLFDGAGDIVGIVAEDRPRSVGNVTLPTRWLGRFSDYAQVGAYRFPRHGEIAWDLPNGEFIYWRGDVLTLEPADL